MESGEGATQFRQTRRFISMKKDIDSEMADELLPEYDFANMTGGVRGKYVERYRQAQNLVLLDPDVAEAFPTEESVNEALRLLMTIAERQVSTTSPQKTGD